MTNESAEQLAGRRLWVGVSGVRLSSATVRHLEQVRPGGVVLFARNLDTPKQVGALVRQLRELLGPRTHVAIDQEGGRVVRFTRDLTVFPGNAALGAIAESDSTTAVELARRQGECGAHELRTLGIDVNLAPVADLAVMADNPAVGDRSFGVDPRVVARLVGALVEGQHRGGVLSTLKHFPGIGTAKVDPHVDLPEVDGPLASSTLEPFRAGVAAGAELVMTSHVRFSALDSVPATFSRVVVEDTLRRWLRYSGVVISDALEMAGLTRHFSWEEIVERTVASGHDVLCLGTDDAELQLRVHELLAAGYRVGPSWLGDAALTARRLDVLDRSLASAAQPRTDVAPSLGPPLAAEIARRSVRIVADPRGSLPLTKRRRSASADGSRGPVVALPTVTARTLAEDRLRGERLELLREGLRDHAEIVEFDSEPDAFALASLSRAAIDADPFVLVLFDVRFSQRRRELAAQALQWSPRVVCLLLSDLQDLVSLPPKHGAAVIVTHGFREVHQRAALQVLLGPA